MRRARILLVSVAAPPAWSEKIKTILLGSENPSFSISERQAKNSDLSTDLGGFEACCRAEIVDVVLVLLGPGVIGHIRLVRSIVRLLSTTPVVLLAEMHSPEDVVELLKAGASDFITPPFRRVNVLPRLVRCLSSYTEDDLGFRELKEKLGLKQLVGESESFKEQVRMLPLVAECDSGVLISGETGTGKELFARAVHYLSARAAKPFVPVSCGAMPADLIENELFGHERGAYTSAFSRQSGLIHLAEGGTLFLDDVDCLPKLVQPKLLRFLESREYRPLGSTNLKTGDVRVVASTNTDLLEVVADGRFRQDLFYRLHVVPIALPPLRDRVGDTLLLAKHFVQKFALKLGRTVTGLTPGARQKLLQYDWPGNVRELEHVIERAVLLSREPLLDSPDIVLCARDRPVRLKSFNQAKRELINQFERSYIERILLAHQGNITKAAQGASKDRRTFWELIRKHGIDAKRYRATVL